MSTATSESSKLNVFWNTCYYVLMDVRTCTHCRVEKPLTNDHFNFKNKKAGKLSYICRPCWKIYHARHYQENKEKYLQQAAVRNKRNLHENRARLWKYLKEHPCIDCGETDPVVLEFDHVRGKKQANLAQLVREVSWERVSTEILKCEVRCRNCHQKRTAKQFGYYAYMNR